MRTQTWRLTFASMLIVPMISTLALGDTTTVLERVKASVFTVKVGEAKNTIFKSGTAFVVTDDGYAITNFHVIQGGSVAVGTFEGARTDVPLELHSVLPEYDLALVKLASIVDGVPRRYKPMKLALDDPKEGTEVWAIGYPTLGYSVTRGIVNGNRVFNKLPAKIQKLLRYGPESKWVQTDCTINRGNSGGPLVNVNGEVLGINTWRWPEEDNAYFALSATHAKTMVDKRPSTALTFAEAVKKYGRVDQTGGTFPRLEIIRSTTASNLANAAVNVHKTGLCGLCKGEGTVDRTVTTTTGGGLIKREEKSTVERECSRCKGSGLPTSATIYRVVAQLAFAAATVNLNDPSTPKAVDQVRLLMKSFSGFDVDGIIKSLQSESKGVLGRRDLKQGVAVVIVGGVVDDRRIPGDGSRYRIIKEAGSGQLFVLADSDVVSATARDLVFAGGLWAGNLDTDDGRVVGVLQGGFMIDVSDSVGQKKEPLPEPGKPAWRAVYDISLIETTIRAEVDGRYVDTKLTVQDRIRVTCNLRNMSTTAFAYSGEFQVLKKLSVPVANPPVLGKALFRTPAIKPGDVYSFELEVRVDAITQLGQGRFVNVVGR